MNKNFFNLSLSFIITFALFNLIGFLIFMGFSGSFEFMNPLMTILKNFIFEENVNYNSVLITSTGVVSFVALILLVFYLINIMAIFSGYFSYNLIALKYEHKSYSLKEVAKNTMQWSFFRNYYVFAPIIRAILAMLLLAFLFVYFFNNVAYLSGINVTLVAFACSFLGISLFMSFLYSIFLIFWRHLKTQFGIDCAVSEPSLSFEEILSRLDKINFSRPINFGIYFLQIAFMVMILSQIIFKINNTEFFDISKSNLFLYVLWADFALYAGLNLLKSYSYINSLLYRFEKITLKDK